MLNFLLAVHFVLTIAIIGLIMLQKHDSDGALGSSGGGAASGLFSVRGQANILTRATAILMTIFMLNCLVMAKIARTVPAKSSIIDRVAEESTRRAAPVPAEGKSTAPESKPMTIPAKEPASKPVNKASKEAAPKPATSKKK